MALIAAAGTVVAALVPLLVRARGGRGETRNRPAVLLPSRVRLVDRSNEVSQILDHLRRGEYMVAIEGSIGVGKSAVAAEVAHRMVDRVAVDGSRMPRRGRRYRWLVWIDAQNGCPTVAGIAAQLSLLSGDQLLSTASLTEKAHVLRTFLAAQPSILILDNVRLTATEAQEFLGFVRTLPSGSVAIVSSNTPGRMAAPRILVRELQRDFMRDLLLREARRLDVRSILDANSALIDEAYDLVGGNARAIELLVVACSRRPTTLRTVIEQVRAGTGDLADELFSRVWTDLPGDDRLVIVVCAYLKGRALPEQVRAALDISADRLTHSVERLWADGLLSALERGDQLYYTCAPALRGFVLNQTATSTVDKIRSRLAAYLIDRFRNDWEDAEGAIPHLDAIRLLVADLHDSGDHGASFDLFEVTLDIFFTLGLFDDRVSLGWLAYDAATSLADPEKQSLALSVVSSTHSLRGEYAEAAHAVDVGLNVATLAGSQREIARQLRCKGYNEFRSGRITEALATVADAEGMALAAGDLHNVVDILALSSAAQWHLGDLDACGTMLDRFLHYCRAIPWERGKAYPIREMGELALMARSYRDAELLLAESRAIAETYRDTRLLVRIALSESRLHLFSGRALRAYRGATDVRCQAGRLGLSGEFAEAQAVSQHALRAILFPPLRYLYRRKPRTRFTPMTIGGD